MRTCHQFQLACMAAGSLAGQLFAAEPAMRDALTGDQIAEMHAQAAKQQQLPQQQAAVVKAQQAPDPSKKAPSESIVAQSDFLSFNGRSTLVPKRAILHIPASLADRVKFTPGNALMTWGDFFAVNRAWVTTVEVSRAQAEGNEALPEATTKMVSKSTSLVVATYKTGPISVLPLKTPPAVDPKAATASKTQTAAAPKKP